jgi:TRAP transporter TAXI family solute receptor
MKLFKKLILTCCLLMAVLVIGGPTQAETDQQLTVASGIIGGGWYSSMAGIFEIIHANVPDVKARMVPGGGMTNQPRVGTHEVDIAWGITPFVAAALAGEKPFPAAYKDLRCIIKPNDLFALQFVVLADSPIETIDGIFTSKYPLKLAVVPEGISDAYAFGKLLDFYGVDIETISKWGGKIMRAGYPDQIELMKDKHVEAVFENTYIPANPVMQIQPFRKLKFLSFEEKHQAYFKKLGFVPHSIPAGSYENQDKPIQTFASGSVMIVNANVPDEVVYKITKVLVEKAEEIRQIPTLKNWDPVKGIKDLPAPLHPGAEKYFKEAGLLK